MRAKRRVIFAVAMLTIFAGCGNKRSQDDKVLFGEDKAPKEPALPRRRVPSQYQNSLCTFYLLRVLLRVRR